MTQLDLGPEPAQPVGPLGGRRRALIVAVAALVTLGSLAFAFLLGAAYFDSRRFAAHATRLQRMQAQAPSIEQVTQGLHDDGSPLVLAPHDETELRAWAQRFDAARREELVSRARRFPLTRVYRASDMFYVIYFDAQGTMRDFACVSV